MIRAIIKSGKSQTYVVIIFVMCELLWVHILNFVVCLHNLVAEFVTVGWGKKETQFHGSEGKHAATKRENVELKVRSTDDQRPRIRYVLLF